ncbi:hypothetical protein FA15DRAFT_614912 [Coprinopsis marcescibilis]|uniref:Multidrug resistance-associated ABC transporter n=1 Tax=Coprinopsis marcescibilis TaxID=230819 RepID=A0A5C3L330_COPMA|nr:hypothetical protein FA15DRAFT_614912 [Coprinopsis marcescibilis]
MDADDEFFGHRHIGGSHHHHSWCPHADSPVDWSDSCIRDAWSAAVPALVVVLLLVWSSARAVGLTAWTGTLIPEGIKELFRPFITVQEAEALGGRDETDSDDKASTTPATTTPTTTHAPLWTTVIFAVVGVFQTLVWLGIASYHFYSDSETTYFLNGLFPLLIAFAWFYTALRPTLWPSRTVLYDLFTVYVALLCAGILRVGGALWEKGTIGSGGNAERTHLEWAFAVSKHDWQRADWAGASLNVFAVLFVLGVLLSMPLNLPTEHIEASKIGTSVSPEDYTSLFGWITFSWIYPLVNRGRYSTLNEEDVWNLSATMRSQPIFTKFSEIKKPSLLRKLWVANSLDLVLDLILTFVSVVFQYSTPIFLKLILDAIGERGTTPPPDASFESSSQVPLSFASFIPTLKSGKGASTSQTAAYIYAFLSFIFTLCKAEADVQHLWYGRRAATRIRSELMAAIYDKALKRRDYAGVVQAQQQQEEKPAPENGYGPKPKKDKRKKTRAEKKKEKKEEKEKAAKADDPKAGADVGKIVNLMAGDANRISQTISGAYFIYGAPLEIIIAGFLLYQLLGLSAFAGFLVLLLGWPLNNYVSRRSIRIQKGVLNARDQRMGVLNELIGAVKFIKFFAWEERWIDRALESREKEMQWMVKARVNSVMFYLLWTLAPILVSIISFMTYVLQGNELTVSVAFTSIALFNMIRTPLNVIPAWIVQILQTGVALKRIAVYLDEDEVDEQVSSLKHSDSNPEDSQYSRLSQEELHGLGLENASLKWNEVPKPKDSGKDKLDGVPEAEDGTNTSSPSSPQEEPTWPTADLEAQLGNGSDTEGLLLSVDAEQTRFELKDLSVRFPEGKLTLVTGPTASGKTALLMAVLGEMTLVSGRIIMHKDPSKVDENGLVQGISYAAQTPWLRHQSIKENILFGQPYDEGRYQQVVDACALKPDLDVLEDGDATEIGARGVSLSGGQKARVALARAVYSRAKYVLLDDPLSAVDSHTSRLLYEKLLRGPLLANRTVVLVTHHVELVLPGAHYLVRMLDGRIDTQGSVQDLRARGLIDDITHTASVDAHRDESALEDLRIEEADMLNNSVGTEPTTPIANEAKKPRKLIKDEHRETGGVKWSIYKSYLKASSYWIWGFLAFMVLVVQILGASEKLWITVWGQAYGNSTSLSHPSTPSFVTLRSFAAFAEHDAGTEGYFSHHHHYDTTFQTVPNIKLESVVAPLGDAGINVLSKAQGPFGIEWPNAAEHPLFYVGIYAAIGLAIALANVLSVTAQYTAALRASRVLFRKLLVTVVRATFRFHDTTPQGRMLNRFGKDIETIDSSLAGSLQAVNSSLASFFAAIIIIAVIFPYFLIPAAFIGLAYRELAVGYLNTGRDLRRMESNTRSPIFSDFGELLEGIVTVRAFSAERRFLNNLHQKIDTTTKMWYAFWMTNRWLLLNFDALGALAVLVTSLFSIATLSRGAGLAGLCITSAMTFTSSVYWACRFWTALELDLNSVERVVEYLDLPQEPPAIIDANRVPAYWPSSSNDKPLVEVENLVIKYAPDLPAVLHGVSFSLRAGERIGLLGRTGSGKSTLAMSILRFVDPVEGKIVIDGIDISTIGIHDLRSRLTFIPQDATLFSGTLRENLDPFDDHSDVECLDVLRRVHLITDSGLASRGSSRAQSAASSRAPSIINVDRETTAGHTAEPSDAQSVVSATSSNTEADPKAKITLDTKVSAGGANFSQGQRQLIAMARALLRKSSIVVLDEATSSIDFATDAKIQTTIREEFGGSLLLTVAHRLRTVIDYDRLIVLDKGQIVEFDTPYNLIRKNHGTFRQMCMKSGTFTELEAAAKAKAEADGDAVAAS